MKPKLLGLWRIPFALTLALGLSAGVTSSAPALGAQPAAPQAAAATAVDPKAIDLLKRSAAKLASLPSFSVHAEATQDDVVRDGYKLQRTMTEDVTVQKPGRMRAELTGDKGRRLFVYDGKAVSILALPENHYATVNSPPTLKETLDALTSRYDFSLPLTDLLYMASGGGIAEHAIEAGVIGSSVVAGAECDHLAFRSKAVDWQIWVDRRDALPKKLVITTRGETEPQYEAILTWNLAPKLSDADFAFAPPAGATPMRLRMADGSLTPAAPGKK